jgi:hypothetical protein
MFIISAEKDGKWIEIKSDSELVIDTIIEGLEKDGYGRISVREDI